MSDPTPPSYRTPTVADGAALWRLAEASGGLDLNTPYAYLLWCRDFAATSAVAELDGAVVGYVQGYRRPDEPDVLFVWQVTTAPAARGRGVAGGMLAWLVDAQGGAVRWVEASVTPSNDASWRTFGALADRLGADVARTPLFGEGDFPTPHEAEVLIRIGPFPAPG